MYWICYFCESFHAYWIAGRPFIISSIKDKRRLHSSPSSNRSSCCSYTYLEVRIMASKLKSFCLTSIFILVIVGITSGVPLSTSRSDHILTKRATGDQFNNGHVMSWKTYNNLLKSKPGTMGNNMDNYFGYVDRHDPRPIQPSQTYSNRKIHTFVVGSRQDVQNAVVNGQVFTFANLNID